MRVIAEDDARPLEPPAPLHVDRPGAVDEDVGHRRILHERLDGTETKGLVLNPQTELLALLPAQRRLVGREHVLDDALDLLLNGLPRQQRELPQVEVLDELAGNSGLELEVARLAGPLRLSHRAVRRHRSLLEALSSLEECHL